MQKMVRLIVSDTWNQVKVETIKRRLFLIKNIPLISEQESKSDLIQYLQTLLDNYGISISSEKNIFLPIDDATRVPKSWCIVEAKIPKIESSKLKELKSLKINKTLKACLLKQTLKEEELQKANANATDTTSPTTEIPSIAVTEAQPESAASTTSETTAVNPTANAAISESAVKPEVKEEAKEELTSLTIENLEETMETNAVYFNEYFRSVLLEQDESEQKEEKSQHTKPRLNKKCDSILNQKIESLSLDGKLEEKNYEKFNGIFFFNFIL